MASCLLSKTSEPLARLVKQIDEKIGEDDKLKSFVVIMPKNGDDPAEDLKKLAKVAGIKNVALTIGIGPNGPPDYEIARDADFTILMWNEYKVKVNHAYKGDLTDKEIGAIRADISKVLSD